MKQKFTVEGMSCVNCSAAVERAVKKLDGIETVEVSLLTKSMVCDFDEKRLTTKKIINAVNKAGYRCSLYGEKSENKSKFLSEKTRLISSVIILLPLMYISMGEMMGIPTPLFLHEYLLVSALIQLVLALAVAVINAKFFVNGFKSLIKLSPNMDSLVAMGSSASFLYGIFSIVMLSVGISQNNGEFIEKYSHGLYFESAAMILTLVTVGKMLEERAKTKTGSAIAKLSKLAPERSNVIRNGIEVEIPSREIVRGDIVVIRPGESIPVDGVIVEGHSEINEAALTGESEPKFKSVGDEVMTATVNLTGAFKMEAKKVGGETVLAKIIELVENTSASKAPVARLADKVAGVFVPIVTAISIVTAIVWLVADYPFDFALSNAISVLVISCPCALGLATPVAITVAVGKCASGGILIKSAEALETLHKTEVAVFDKTGTLTKGHPAVNDAVAIGCDEKELLDIALSLENSSEHPLARAVCEYAKSKGAVLTESSSFEAVGGRGVNACVENFRYYAGNIAYMDELGIDASPWHEDIKKLSEEGKTVMFFTDGKKLLGFIAASDEINEDAPKALEMLDNLGVETVMLTGDSELSAKATAKKLGIKSVISGVLPSEKGNTVKALCESGKTVIMTGDGINDAPALIAADVGIAVGAGTDIAIDSADIVLVKNSLTDIAETIKYSRRVMTNIKENLFWAFFYNAICIPIAAGALYPLWQITLSPMIASASMSLSSIFVVTNALRLYKK
ncbi:MAG: heavy metal translocating P-type ATPase [Clostridia bacterium]|nr:heavy metal translocating P-type ATPase [Clostridia bacterium]